MYEPLLGGPKDDRIVTAPAVRIAVLKFALGHERSARLQQPNYGGIGIEYRVSLILRQTFGKAPVICQRSVRLHAIFLTHFNIRTASIRGRMDDRAACVQSYL